MSTDNKIVNFFQNVTTGGLAASISKTLNAPLERVKLINQTNPGRYKGLVDCLVSLPKEEGIFAYWRGNGTNVIRYFPTQALNFAFKVCFNFLSVICDTLESTFSHKNGYKYTFTTLSSFQIKIQF